MSAPALRLSVTVCVWSAKGQGWRGGSVPAATTRREPRMWVGLSLSTYNISLIMQRLSQPSHHHTGIVSETSSLICHYTGSDLDKRQLFGRLSVKKLHRLIFIWHFLKVTSAFTGAVWWVLKWLVCYVNHPLSSVKQTNKKATWNFFIAELGYQSVGFFWHCTMFTLTSFHFLNILQ